MKVKFISNYTVKDGSGKEYKEGDIEDFTTSSALHFINRGAAIEAIEPPKKPKATDTITLAKSAGRSTRRKPEETTEAEE